MYQWRSLDPKALTTALRALANRGRSRDGDRPDVEPSDSALARDAAEPPAFTAAPRPVAD